MHTVAVDIGGTFTDVVVIDGDDGRTYSGKALTTPDDLQRGVFDGLADAAREVGVDVGALLARHRAHGPRDDAIDERRVRLRRRAHRGADHARLRRHADDHAAPPAASPA